MTIAVVKLPDVSTTGKSGLAARRAGRRELLVAAAIEVYRRCGYSGSTVRAICREASLTERYFYESFANPEALLSAAYDEVNRNLDRLLRAALESAPPGGETQLPAVLSAFFGRLREDRGGAQVFLAEIQGISPAIDAQFRAAVRHFGEGLAEIVPGLLDAPPLFLDGIGGGLIQIALAWIASDYACSEQDVLASALLLFAGVSSDRCGSAVNLTASQLAGGG